MHFRTTFFELLANIFDFGVPFWSNLGTRDPRISGPLFFRYLVRSGVRFLMVLGCLLEAFSVDFRTMSVIKSHMASLLFSSLPLSLFLVYFLFVLLFLFFFSFYSSLPLHLFLSYVLFVLLLPVLQVSLDISRFSSQLQVSLGISGYLQVSLGISRYPQVSLGIFRYL